jgi:hypothetical protein
MTKCKPAFSSFLVGSRAYTSVILTSRLLHSKVIIIDRHMQAYTHNHIRQFHRYTEISAPPLIRSPTVRRSEWLRVFLRVLCGLRSGAVEVSVHLGYEAAQHPWRTETWMSFYLTMALRLCVLFSMSWNGKIYIPTYNKARPRISVAIYLSPKRKASFVFGPPRERKTTRYQKQSVERQEDTSVGEVTRFTAS